MSEFQQKILDKILEKATKAADSSSTIADKVESQGKTLDKISPKITGIRNSTTKIENTVITVSEKVKESVTNSRDLGKDFKKALTKINKMYSALVIDGLNNLPKDMKASIKEDRSLLRDILATVNVANEKLNRIGSNSRSIKAKAENLEGKNNVVVNITANGPGASLAAEEASSKETNKQLYEIKAIIRTISNNMKPNRLKDKEDKEDSNKASNKESSKGKSKKKGSNKEDKDSSGFGLGSLLSTGGMLSAGLTALTALAAGRFALSEGGYDNEAMRAAKLSTGLMQKGGVSKIADIYKGAKGMGQRVGLLKPKTVAKEVIDLKDFDFKDFLKSLDDKAIKEGEKTMAKAAKNTILKESASKAAAWTVKKVGKKLPIVGLGIGAAFAAQRALEGDFWGAGLELASGIASLMPGIGTMVSIGIDGILVAKDISKNSKHISEEMRSAAEASERFANVMLQTAEKAAATGSKQDADIADLAKTQAESNMALQSLPFAEKKLKEKMEETGMNIPLNSIKSDMGKILEKQSDLSEDGIKATLKSHLSSRGDMGDIEKYHTERNEELLQVLRLSAIAERNKAKEESFSPAVRESVSLAFKEQGKKDELQRQSEYENHAVNFSRFFSQYAIEKINGEQYIRNIENNTLLTRNESSELLEEAGYLTKKIEHIMSTPSLKMTLERNKPELYEYMENLYENHRYSKAYSQQEIEMNRQKAERGIPTAASYRPTMKDFSDVTTSRKPVSYDMRPSPNVSSKAGVSSSMQDMLFKSMQQKYPISVNPNTVMNTTTISNSSPTLLQPTMEYNSYSPLFWNGRNK